MNKYRITIALASVVGLLASCADFLSPIPTSKYVDENYYKIPLHAEMAVLGLYNTLENEQLYGRNLIHYFDLDTDVSQVLGGTNTGQPDGERRSIARYSYTSSTKQVDGVWNALYRCINQASDVIARIPQMEAYKSGGADSLKLERNLGEALTIRAICYFDLIRYWGDVPFKTNATVSTDNYDLARTSRDEIYDYIILDLQKALKKIPRSTDTERFSKDAVSGILARICLYAGGYSLRWDLNSYDPATRQMARRPKTGMLPTRDGSNDDTEKIRELYQLANDCLVDIISSGGYSLIDDGVNGFEKYWKNICSHTIPSSGQRESLFEVAFFSRTGIRNEGGYHGYYSGVRAGSSNEAYGECSGGVVFMPGFFLSFKGDRSYDSNGNYVDIPYDTRRDVSCWAMSFSNTTTPEELYCQQKGKPTSLSSGNPAKWRKMWAPAKIPTITNFNFPLLRYSDVLLMFAESEAYLNNAPTSEAVQALKQVRKRAMIPSQKAAIDGETYPSDYAGFLDVLVQERAFELAFEGFRKTDLIRWGKLAQTIQISKNITEELTATVNGSGSNVNAVYPMDGIITEQRGKALPSRAVYGENGADKFTKVVYRNVGNNNNSGLATPRNTVFLSTAFAAEMAYFAVGFKAEESELIPIPTTVLLVAPSLKQLPGAQ